MARRGGGGSSGIILYLAYRASAYCIYVHVASSLLSHYGLRRIIRGRHVNQQRAINNALAQQRAA